MARQATPASNGPSSAASAASAAAAASSSGMRRRNAPARPAGRSVGGSSAGILRFYTDDAPGLKVGPTTVLVLCLMFVGFVVLLHIWGKFRG